MQITVEKEKEEKKTQNSSDHNSEIENTHKSDDQELEDNEVEEKEEGKKSADPKKEKRKPIKVDIDVKDKSLDELKALIRTREEERTKVLEKLKEINQCAPII